MTSQVSQLPLGTRNALLQLVFTSGIVMSFLLERSEVPNMFSKDE